ncbi:hypothetical protein G4B88_008950 [Cannabis sativa]|uniref:RRM domain-containing protein n=1 Tax=Cannabis sativa TaxID=3483 RepID=A0A7J6HPB1_CANSA|nr:hypothetical protein G4B88_008950 [Cannabis sativa]
MQQHQQQTRTVQVKKVSDLATEREIHEFFSFSGEIEHIQIYREHGQSKTAFVTFKDPKALEIALLLSCPNDDLIQLHNYFVFISFSICNETLLLLLSPSCLNSLDFDSELNFEVFLEWTSLQFDFEWFMGATIVDQIVSITPVENYVPNHETQEARMVENAVCVVPEPGSPNLELHYYGLDRNSPRVNGREYVSKAQDAVANMLAKGSAIRQDAVNKAKAFDEKHQLRASASAKVISFDRKVGLTEKLTVGISVVNEKVKSVDQRLQVSDKTMAAIFAAERKINNTGSAVKTSRYVTAGAAWLNGAFSKVAKAGQVAGTKTREKFHMAVTNLTTKVFALSVLSSQNKIGQIRTVLDGIRLQRKRKITLMGSVLMNTIIKSTMLA